MSIFTAKKEPVANNPLAELNEKLADLQGRQQEAQRLLTEATNELMPLLVAQRRVDLERPQLVQARQSTQSAVEDAEQAVRRAIGKPDEASAIEALEQAEQALQNATQALVTLDASFDRENAHKRILQLREVIQTEERRELELCRAYGKTKEERRIVALTSIYSTLSQLYELIDYGGASMDELRIDQPEAFDQLISLLCIDRDELGMLFVQIYNIGLQEDYRPELRARQAAIREGLASLKKAAITSPTLEEAALKSSNAQRAPVRTPHRQFTPSWRPTTVA